MRAAADVSTLDPTIIVRTIVSPRRGIGASLPVRIRRAPRSSWRRADGGPGGPTRFARPRRPRSPDPRRSEPSFSTGRLLSTPPSTSKPPVIGGDGREHAGDSQARVERLRHRTGLVDNGLASDQIAAQAEEPQRELLDQPVAELLLKQAPHPGATDDREDRRDEVLGRTTPDEMALEGGADVARGRNRQQPWRRPTSRG